MSEVQSHGFIWESDLLRNVYGMTQEEKAETSYTEKFDLPSRFNHLESANISVKCIGEKNAICMGDALRVFDEVSETDALHLTVIHYKQVGETKEVVSIKELNLSKSKDLLFGSLTRDQVAELDRLIKAVPQKRAPTDDEKKAIKAKQAELNRSTGFLQFNPKVNTQQSRLQCSFSCKDFQGFLTRNPERIVAQSTSNQFRGSAITAVIQAGRRVFH